MDKPLERLTKKKKRRDTNYQVGNPREDITTNFTDIKRKIRENNEQLYRHKFSSLDDTD